VDGNRDAKQALTRLPGTAESPAKGQRYLETEAPLLNAATGLARLLSMECLQPSASEDSAAPSERGNLLYSPRVPLRSIRRGGLRSIATPWLKSFAFTRELPTAVSAPARPVARGPRRPVVVVSRRIVIRPIIATIKVRRAPRCAVGRTVIVPLVVIDGLAVVALIEVVEQERKRERNAPAYLRLSLTLGCKQQDASSQQTEQSFHGGNYKLGPVDYAL